MNYLEHTAKLKIGMFNPTCQYPEGVRWVVRGV